MPLICSSLNWVTPQMLGVPFPDEKVSVTGDPFLPAITGDLKSQYLNEQFDMVGNAFICFLI